MDFTKSRQWAALREMEGIDPEQVQEAIFCASAMEDWRKENRAQD